jgi:uncharacterized protein (TIGR04255 family)
MPAPTLKLERPPIIHVLAAIRFNPLAAAELEGASTAMLRALRDHGYLEKVTALDQNYNIVLPHLDDQGEVIQPPKVELTQKKSLVFVRNDKLVSVTVSEVGFSFQATQYSNFPQFCEELMTCLACVSNSLDGAYKQVWRLGLRYVNLIPLDPEKPSSFWVHDELLGRPLEKLEAIHHHSSIERLYVVDKGRLSIRFSDIEGQPPLPPGINPVGLKMPATVANFLPNGRFAILDLDRFHAERFDFDLKSIKTELERFNHLLTTYFSACTTDDAKKIWGILSK